MLNMEWVCRMGVHGAWCMGVRDNTGSDVMDSEPQGEEKELTGEALQRAEA